MKFISSLSFSKKYIFALSLIATLSVLGYLNLTHLIESQANDAKIINMSGKQRMLSQRILFYSVANHKEKLKKSIELMRSSHTILTHIPMSKELQKLYFSQPIDLDKEVKAFLNKAEEFANDGNKKSLSYLLKNAQKILQNLDQAVSLYQKETEEKTVNLQQKELLILLLTLLTLLLEALFIFRPANNIINKKTAQLNKQKDYLEMITQINTNGIIAVNDNFEILTFNKSAEKMFGYSAKEMLFTKLTDERIIPHSLIEQHNKGLANFMRTGELKHKENVFELQAQKKDKTIFPIRISFGIKVDEKERIVVANIQDITKERDKDNLIIQQSRFAAMGEMIGNIAHQWRQPLSSISTLATGAKMRYKNNLITDEELEDVFRKIKENTQYLSQTIDDFRDFFKNEKTEEIFDIKDVIRKSTSLIEAAYVENNIHLILRKTEEKCLIHGSSSQLSQVFLNILNNAKDALKGKAIPEKIVCIEVVKEKESILVEISDNAGGIDDEISAKIYEPYFTTKHKSQGTGVGLFMSKKIIEQLFSGALTNKNDTLYIEGKKYFGAKFMIKLQGSTVEC